MIRDTNNIELTNSLSVNKTNTDEKGRLCNGNILQEVARINDEVIIRTFGQHHFPCISVSRYHVCFHEAALSGDTLKINSSYTYSDALGLMITIKVHKTKARKNITVLTGDFTFINNQALIA